MEPFYHLSAAAKAVGEAKRPEVWAALVEIIGQWGLRLGPRITYEAMTINWMHMRSSQFAWKTSDQWHGVATAQQRAGELFDELKDLLLAATQRGEIIVTVARDLSTPIALAPGLLRATFLNHGKRLFPFDFMSNQVTTDWGQWLPVLSLTWTPQEERDPPKVVEWLIADARENGLVTVSDRSLWLRAHERFPDLTTRRFKDVLADLPDEYKQNKSRKRKQKQSVKQVMSKPRS